MQAQLKVVQNTESLRDAMVTRMIEREIVVNAQCETCKMPSLLIIQFD